MPKPKRNDEGDFQYLNINYDYNKKKQPAFKYYLPLEWKPENPSNKLLFPERWKFYDYDFNKIKFIEMQPISFAQNRS